MGCMCSSVLDWLHVAATALQAALQLAEQISAFPQQCLRADRSSAMYSCYDAPSFAQVHLTLYTLIPHLWHQHVSFIWQTYSCRFFHWCTDLNPCHNAAFKSVFFCPGHAVWDGPRSSCHPVRSRRRGNQVHWWSRKRRKILLGFSLQRPCELGFSGDLKHLAVKSC